MLKYLLNSKIFVFKEFLESHNHYENYVYPVSNKKILLLENARGVPPTSYPVHGTSMGWVGAGKRGFYPVLVLARGQGKEGQVGNLSWS